VSDQRHAPAALPPGKRHGSHCTVGCVGLGAGLDGSRNSRQRRISQTGRSLYRLRYSDPSYRHHSSIFSTDDVFHKIIFVKPKYNPDGHYKRSYRIIAPLLPPKAANLIPEQHTVLITSVYTRSVTQYIGSVTTKLFACLWTNTSLPCPSWKLTARREVEGGHSRSEIRWVLTGDSCLPACNISITQLQTVIWGFHRAAVFWDMTPCSPICHRSFGGARCLHLQGSRKIISCWKNM
jgi:hypothetical protein